MVEQRGATVVSRVQQIDVFVRHGDDGTIGEMSADPKTAWPDGLVVAHRDHFADLVRVAVLIMGSRAEAEDIVHDVFIGAAPRWSAIETPVAYLRRGVVNRSRSVLRRRATADRLRPDPPPPSAPDQLVELRDVLLGLPVRQRAAIALRYIEGLDDVAIGAALQCRPATVRSLRARGLQRVRKELS